jgi:oligopeptide transport system substrate-binding protein
LTDANTRHSEYLAGQLDIVDESGGEIDSDSQNPSLKDQIHFWPRAATYYVSFGEIAQPIFRNKLVRQAFAYATDKDRIVQEVFAGNRDVAQDILAEGIPGWSKSFQGIPYDPARAQKLLAEAGYPGGKGFPSLSMSYRESNPDLAKTVDLLREMYGQTLGVTITPRQTEWSTMLTQEDNKALPIYHMRWSADYLDPQDFYSLLYHSGADQNNTGYINPVFDSICDQADSDQNSAERAELYRKAARILADDVPMIPLYYQRDPELVKPYVHGLDDSLMGHLPYKHVELGR